ncbi:MAG: permease [Candidatus Latescibacter sp.]|nr:permease [Candidatus Latescibacter sp.]
MTHVYEILNFFYNLYFTIEKLFYGTYTEKIIANTWALFQSLWYYVLFGVLAAVFISELMSHEKVRGFLNRSGGIPILFAAVLGILSPMCTFAAIPLVGGLAAVGVPLAPLMAFLIASPLMNPSLFIITWGVMGPEMALARTFSALLLGVIGGWTVEFSLSRGAVYFKNPLKEGFTAGNIIRSCPSDGSPLPSRARVRGFIKHTYKMFVYISKYFILALFLAGAVQAFIKPEWIAALLGGGGFKSVLLGGLLGIPLYVCGGGTVALIGVLVSMGMGQGAALAFFITGPATKISTIVSLHAVLRKQVALVYLAVTLIGGVLLGYGYSMIAPPMTLDSRYYGKVESKEDSIIYKPGIGSPSGD